jgi:hypothetical protein
MKVYRFNDHIMLGIRNPRVEYKMRQKIFST